MKNFFKQLSVGFHGILLGIITVGVVFQVTASELSSSEKTPTVGVVANPSIGPKSRKIKIKSDELLVKFKSAVSPVDAGVVLRAHGANQVKEFRKTIKNKPSKIGRWRHVKLKANVDVKGVIDKLSKHPKVELVEPNFEYTIDLVPTEESFNELWGLHNTGQSGGLADADIDAPEAWDFETGNPDLVVAVIDTGVDWNHVDLSENMWINTSEIAGNAIDDDGNGFIDDVYGYDFSNSDGDPDDDNGHGTHVAGTIAAPANGIGVVGVVHKAKIMALKTLAADGGGSSSDSILAIEYAIAMGADVINASWGGTGFSQALKDAIADANTAGILFVAAAGNENTNNDSLQHYPSGYDLPNVISVAATDSNDLLAGFSNYGVSSVDLGAPGVSILSTWPNDQLAYSQGTSMAAPHVAGAAMVLLSDNPSLSVLDLRDKLLNTVDTIPALSLFTHTGGRLNLYNALACDPLPLTLNITSHTNDFIALKSEPGTLAARVSACGPTVTGATVVASFNNGEPSVTLLDDGAHFDGVAGDGVYGNTWIPTNLGPVTISVDASHPNHSSNSVSRTGVVAERIEYLRQSVAFSWVDATLGSQHELGNDDATTIPIGFDFEFYGVTYNELNIGSNGLVSFSADNTNNFSNTTLPSQSVPNNLIAAFWDDLNPAAGGTVYSLVDGVAPNRRLTVSWVDVPALGAVNGLSFQVILHESNGDIIVQHQDVQTGNSLVDFGASATVGIEDSNGVFGNLSSFNLPVISDNSAIRFYRNDSLLEVTYRVVIDSTPIIANGGYVAMDMIDGDGVNNNQLKIIEYTTDGSLLLNPEYVGDSSGSFIPGPAAVGDGQFVNGISQATVYGNTISFDLAISSNGPYLPIPDTLAFYLLDSAGLPFSTTDPLGTDSIFSIEINNPEPVPMVFESDFATASVQRTGINQTPVANPGGPYSGVSGQVVAFNGSASTDPDSDPLTYNWNFGDGNTGVGVSPGHTYASPGTYTVTLVVNDGQLDSLPVTTVATIVEPNIAPIANPGGPYSGVSGQVVAFNGSASTDPDSDPLTYNWDFGDGNTGAGVSPGHAYASPGTYTVTLVVNDGQLDSLPVTTVATIVLPNIAPTANPSGPYNGVVGSAVEFDGSASSDPNGDSLSYNWDFGDGNTGSGVDPNHTYTSEGVYTVTLIVNDGILDSAPAITTVTIGQGNNAPVADPNGPYTGFINTPILFDGSGSSDQDGDTLTYAWEFGDGNTGVGVNPSHVYSGTGTYTVRLVVSDGITNSSPASTTVTVDNIKIDNDLPTSEVGSWRIEVRAGGESREGWLTALGTPSGTQFNEAEIIFDYFTYVDIGDVGSAFRLSSTATSGPEMINNGVGADQVRSSGSFIGENGNLINWRVDSTIEDGSNTMVNTFTFVAQSGEIGRIRLWQYLDEDVLGESDDIFFVRGSSAELDLEMFTVDNSESIGVSHSGSLSSGQGLVNSNFTGYAACKYNLMKSAIVAGSQNVSLDGSLCSDLLAFPIDHPVIGEAYGPIDVVSSLAWDVEPNATTATIITTLGGVPTAPVFNEPPVCSTASPSIATLWSPDHSLVPISINGVTDPDDDEVSISIVSVTQDEPINGKADGNTSPDAFNQTTSVLIRSERAGNRNGRVYQINFEADDGNGGNCTGSVKVEVPHSNIGNAAVDDGQIYNSF